MTTRATVAQVLAVLALAACSGDDSPPAADAAPVTADAAPVTADAAPPALDASTNPCEGVTCTALDDCHEVGTCDEATGRCSNPVSPDSKACDDSTVCTEADHCDGAGTCIGTAVVCPMPDGCHVQACDPVDGCGAPHVPPPVSRWSAEGDYADSAGSSDGAPLGGVSFATGLSGLGQAFAFDGSDGAVVLPVIPTMSGPSVTFAAWVHASQLGRGQQWILGQNFGTQLVISPHDALLFQFRDSGGGFYITEDPATAPADGWVHVVGTLAPVSGTDPVQTRVALYRNGVLAATQTFTAEPFDSECPSVIGGADGCDYHAQYFDGMLDELLLYDHAVDAAGAFAIFAGTIAGVLPDGTDCGGGCTCLDGVCQGGGACP